jgi:general secretion pathway protein G
MMKHQKSHKLRATFARGFTLIELLVVLAIIGLITSVVAPRVMGALAGAKEKTAQVQVDSLRAAVDMFSIDAGRIPSASEGLRVLVERPADMNFWAGPYVRDGRIPKDPWGNEYVYVPLPDGSDFSISIAKGKSVGADPSPAGAQ